jgi:hypothetical protein
MPTPWDSIPPEVQAEFQGYFANTKGISSDIKQAALDHMAYAWADIGNTGQQVLFGRNMPATPQPGGDTETTTTTSEPIEPPQSFSAALMEHEANRSAEVAANHYRTTQETEAKAAMTASSYGVAPPSGAAAPASSSASNYGVAPSTNEAVPDSSASSYGIAPPSNEASPDSSAASYGVGAPSGDATPSATSSSIQEPDAYEPEL